MILKSRFKDLVSDDVQKHLFHLITTRVWQCLSWVFIWSSMSLLLAASLLSVAIAGVVFYDVGLLYDGLFKAAQPLFNEHFQKEYVVFPFWIMYLQVVIFLGLLLSQKSRLWREILPRIFELRYAFFSRLVFGCFIATCIGAEFRILEILDAAFIFSINSAMDFAAAQSANFMFSDFSELPGGGMFLVALVAKLLQLVLLLTLHKRYGTLLLLLCAPGLRFISNGAPIVFPLFPFGEADGYALESAFGGKKITPGSKPNSVVNQATRSFCVGSNKNICWKVAKDAYDRSLKASARSLEDFNRLSALAKKSNSAAKELRLLEEAVVSKSELAEQLDAELSVPELTLDKLNMTHIRQRIMFGTSSENAAFFEFFYKQVALRGVLATSSKTFGPRGEAYLEYSKTATLASDSAHAPIHIIRSATLLANALDEHMSSENIEKGFKLAQGWRQDVPEKGLAADRVVTASDRAYLLEFKSCQSGPLTVQNQDAVVTSLAVNAVKAIAPHKVKDSLGVSTALISYTSYDPSYTPEKVRNLVLKKLEGDPYSVILKSSNKFHFGAVAAVKDRLCADPSRVAFVNRVSIPIYNAFGKPLTTADIANVKAWAKQMPDSSEQKK